MQPTFKDIQKAAERIRSFVHRTPVMTNQALDERLGAKIFLKCENLQKVGAFKFRGAINAVFSLSEKEVENGVVTHSSGNHAQAVALAARLRGIPAYIVMPRNAPAVKQAAVADYGAEIILCQPTLEARESVQSDVVAQAGATVVHPYNDPLVIAGQGTAALELLIDHPHLEIVMTPVGGGGLLSGTALTAKTIKPDIHVIAGEPAGADDAYRSLQAGRIIPSTDPQTIADGLLTSLGTLTFPIIQEHVDQIVPVSESAIIAAMRFVWERTKLIIEPSAAVPLAVLWEEKIDVAGAKIGVIVSGGNVDLGRLPW